MKRLAAVGLIVLGFSASAQTLSPFFSPKGGAQDQVVLRIKAAQKSVFLAGYYLTSLRIMDALVEAKMRGVDVKVILDSSMDRVKCCGRALAERVPVCYDKSHAIFHNKYIVIDELTTITGSYNWTGAAETGNAENLLVVSSVPLAKKYKDNWQFHWDNHCPK